jgi:hypothetical protein
MIFSLTTAILCRNLRPLNFADASPPQDVLASFTTSPTQAAPALDARGERRASLHPGTNRQHNQGGFAMKLILKTGLLAAMMFALVGSSSAQAAIYGGSLTASGCNAGKAKCVIKMKSCLLGCYGKAIKGGVAADPACLAKCRNGFLADPATGKGCMEKLNAKNAGCTDTTLAEIAVMRSKIDAHVLDLISQLNPNGGTPANGCTAGKIKCVSKYNACVLGIAGKAFKAGGPIGSLAKCDANLVNLGKATCVEKLETKNPPASPTACLTYNDQGALKAADDAFVNDVLYSLQAGPQNMATKRCTGDTSVQCTNTVPDCNVAGGTCEFFFGAPLPLAAGGVASCVSSQWNGTITGTFNQGTGEAGGSASVLSRVYTGGNTINAPCPICAGNDIPNDGVAGGTCSAGTRAGLTCDSNGESPNPTFGKTSLDCPPPGGTLVATLPIDLTNTNTGTVTATVSASSPNCNGSPGDKCLCASCSGNSSIPCESDAECALAGAGTCTNGAGEPRRPNACLDDTTQVGDGSVCAATAGGEGRCSEGPFDQHCAFETFRSCTGMPGDCPVPGDTCITEARECFVGHNGNIGDSITAVGTFNAGGLPRNHTGTTTFASVFCIAPTGSTAVNSAAGLPGPGRLQLAGVSSENGTDNPGGTCPTEATFLPTAKGGVLDTGWTGLAHDARVVGQGKVTVSAACVGTPGSCTCTYTGPIANP